MPGYGDLFVGGIKPIVSAALEVSHRLAVGTGSLTWMTVHNYNATARTVLLLDTASVTQPANGAVTPIWAYPIAGSTATGPGAFGVDFTNPPIQFVNGLWVIMTTSLTTPFTLTAAGASDGYFSAGVNLA